MGEKVEGSVGWSSSLSSIGATILPCLATVATSGTGPLHSHARLRLPPAFSSFWMSRSSAEVSRAAAVPDAAKGKTKAAMRRIWSIVTPAAPLLFRPPRLNRHGGPPYDSAPPPPRGFRALGSHALLAAPPI